MQRVFYGRNLKIRTHIIRLFYISFLYQNNSGRKNESRRINDDGNGGDIYRGDFTRKGIKSVGVSIEGISLEFHDWSERVALHNSWKSRGIDTSSRLAGKKRRTDPRRQITRGRDAGPSDELKLSGQVRPMSRSRAFVRHDICFLFRRTYTPRRIYMSHWNRPTAGSSYGIGTGFRRSLPRVGYAVRFDLRKRVASPSPRHQRDVVKDSTLYYSLKKHVRDYTMRNHPELSVDAKHRIK